MPIFQTKEKVFIFGNSGHAKVVIDIIEREGRYDIAFLVDDDPTLKNIDFYGYRVIGGKQELLAGRERISSGIVAIGSNSARNSVATWLMAHGFNLVTAIHPSAQVGRGVAVGSGSVIMAGSVINSDSRIGRNVIVNTRAGIDHDCTIGYDVHLALGTVLCGSVTIGGGTFVCAGSTIIPNLTIGSHVTIGAGSTVIRDVPDGVTIMGSPAKSRC